MQLIFVTGGARSGKSRYGERLAVQLSGDDVTYVATAMAGDAEMAARIARHRDTRPAGWITREATTDAAAAVREAASAVVLLDCLTLLASNTFLARVDDGEEAARVAVQAEVRGLLDVVSERPGTLIVVTNEIGCGVVPESALGRWFRDALGEANQTVAAAADEVVLLVSGIPLTVKRGPASSVRTDRRDPLRIR